MENKLEPLLNSLIEKGWRPRGIEVKKILNLGEGKIIFIAHGKENFSKLRFLTVKESGLWQFVCENEMVKKGGLFWELGYSSGEIDLESRRRRQDYEYWLIESALKDESELEDFLLSNIKIEGH